MQQLNHNLTRLFTGLLVLFAVACAPAEKTVTIIAVNDIHGNIDAFPRLATLVEQYRAADSTHLLLIDGGDRWTGNPYVDLNVERGQPMIDLANLLRFDLATHGNHEFDFGLDVLAKRVGESDFPYVVANLDSNGSPLPQPDPYRCFDVDGVKVCFLGLITTARAGYPDGFLHNFGTIKFSNPISTALSFRSLRDSCDVLVGLTHIGYDLDSVLAVQMPELDVILGGHSHTLVPDGKRIGKVLVTQAASRLQYANVITVKVRGHKVSSVTGSLVKLDTVAPDPRYAGMIEEYKKHPELLEVKGSLATDLNKAGVMNLVTDLVRESTGADMAIYNWGGIRVDSLPSGPIRVVDIYSIEPFGNSVHLVQMTTDQLKEIILNKFNSIGKESHREDLYPSGFTYRIRTNAKGEGVDVIFNIARKPSASGTYTVAMSDYVATAYNFSAAGTGEPTGIMVAPLLMEYFVRHSPVRSDNTPRITIGR